MKPPSFVQLCDAQEVGLAYSPVSDQFYATIYMVPVLVVAAKVTQGWVT